VVCLLGDSRVSVSPTGSESATGRALIGPRPGRGRPECAIEVEPGKMKEQTVAGYGGCGTEGGFEPERGTRRGSRRRTKYNFSVLRTRILNSNKLTIVQFPVSV
jgi:hypothetical protein